MGENDVVGMRTGCREAGRWLVPLDDRGSIESALANMIHTPLSFGSSPDPTPQDPLHAALLQSFLCVAQQIKA